MRYLTNIVVFIGNWKINGFSIIIILLFVFNLDTKAEYTSDLQVDSLNNMISSGNLTKKQLGDIYYKVAKLQYQLENTEEAIEQYNNSLKNYNEIKDNLSKVNVLIELGVIYHQQNKFDKALECFYSAFDILPSIETDLSKDKFNLYNGIILLDISIIFGEVKYYETALKYATKSDEYMATLDSVYIASSSSNLGTIYLGLRRLKIAQEYFNKSLKYYGTGSGLNNLLPITYKNLGTSYLKQKDYNHAIHYFEKAIDFYNADSNLYINERAGVLAEIARVYAENGEINKATYNLNLALKLAKEKNANRFIEDIYESFVELYTAMDNPEKALESLKNLNTVRDSLYNYTVLENIINIQKKYEQKKIIEENEIKIKVLEQEKTIIQYRLLVFSGLLMILVLFVLLLFFRLRYKNRLNKIELINSKLEQEQLANKLDFKNQEFTNFVMYIVKKNEILEKIRSQINALNSSIDKDAQINQLSVFINQHLDSFTDSKELELRIENEYQDFHYKLETLFPDLTEKDKKLCSLLLLDLSSKDIASVLNIESSSVDKSRYRLRKKMEIEGDISFSTFLRSL